MARIRTRSLFAAMATLLLSGSLGACASVEGEDEQEVTENSRPTPDISGVVDMPDAGAIDAAIVQDTVDDVASGDSGTLDVAADSGTDAIVGQDTVTDVRPDATPDAAADTASDVVADTTPDVAPDTSPDVVADTGADVAPDVVPAELCANGLDDDGDGTTDCGDADCADDPACTSVDGPCGPVNVATVGTNTATASSDDIALTCAIQPGPEAVFRFTPDIAGTYCLRTDASGVSDTVLEGRFDCADSETLLGCFDDTAEGSLFAESDLIAEAGTAYDLIVESYAGTPGDSVTLTIEEGSCVDAGPGFETCTNPFVVSAYGEYGGPAFSDEHVGSCSSTFLSYEAVIEFVAPETTRVCADTDGSLIDTVLWVQESCDTATELDCEDDSEGLGLQSAVSWDAVAGQSYFVFIEEYDSSLSLSGAQFAYNIAACP
ncbi:MAG: hypothetical protein ACI81R_003697 [Bradymonadia bacterium]|jgi:hypothetical protein